MRLINRVKECEEEAVLNEYVDLRLEETEWRGALTPPLSFRPANMGSTAREALKPVRCCF